MATFIYEDATKRWSPEAGGYVDKKTGSLISKMPVNSTPAPAVPAAKPVASAPSLTPQQQAQNWLNNPASGFTGGLGGYTASQQDRYNQAVTRGNADLVSRLQADAQRVGYNLTAPQPAVKAPVPAPVTTTTPAAAPAPAQPVSPAVVSKAINDAVSAQPSPSQPVFTPQQQYADPSFINDIVSRLVSIMSPATDITRRNINQSYDLGQQRLMEGLNARGVLYGDIGQGNINLNEQQRQQALTDVDAQTQAQALAQALQFAQLPMQERAQQYGEFSTDRGFNADQLRWQAEMLNSIFNADRSYDLSRLQTMLPYEKATAGQLLPYTMGPTPEALLPYQSPTASQMLPYTMGPTPGELLPYQQATANQMLPYTMGPTPESLLPYQQPTVGQQLNFEQALLPWTQGMTPAEQETVKRLAGQLEETIRSHRVNEDIQRGQLGEDIRSARAGEALAADKAKNWSQGQRSFIAGEISDIGEAFAAGKRLEEVLAAIDKDSTALILRFGDPSIIDILKAHAQETAPRLATTPLSPNYVPNTSIKALK